MSVTLACAGVRAGGVVGVGGACVRACLGDAVREAQEGISV